MKERPFFSRLSTVSLSLIAIVTLFSACKKNTDVVTKYPAAGLMAFNLAPDKASVGFAISGNNLTNFPLAYTNYTGAYQGVYVGNRDVTSYDLSSGATLATASQLFKDSAYYSAFLLEANGTYENIIVEDKLDSLPATTGNAFVRYVNGITDSTAQPLVTISSNGTNVFNTNSPFATVSAFKEVSPGNVAVNVNTESATNTSRTISVESNKVYTILLVGVPSATDSAKAVQIKFIQNGTITP